MYSKKHCSLFHNHTVFYKNGIVFAWHYEDGSWNLASSTSNPVSMTRSQGFRYWEKHFPSRPCWLLPALIEAAVAIPPEIESDVCVYEDGGYIHHGIRE